MQAVGLLAGLAGVLGFLWVAFQHGWLLKIPGLLFGCLGVQGRGGRGGKHQDVEPPHPPPKGRDEAGGSDQQQGDCLASVVSVSQSPIPAKQGAPVRGSFLQSAGQAAALAWQSTGGAVGRKSWGALAAAREYVASLRQQGGQQQAQQAQHDVSQQQLAGQRETEACALDVGSMQQPPEQPKDLGAMLQALRLKAQSAAPGPSPAAPEQASSPPGTPIKATFFNAAGSAGFSPQQHYEEQQPQPQQQQQPQQAQLQSPTVESLERQLRELIAQQAQPAGMPGGQGAASPRQHKNLPQNVQPATGPSLQDIAASQPPWQQQQQQHQQQQRQSSPPQRQQQRQPQAGPLPLPASPEHLRQAYALMQRLQRQDQPIMLTNPLAIEEYPVVAGERRPSPEEDGDGDDNAC